MLKKDNRFRFNNQSFHTQPKTTQANKEFMKNVVNSDAFFEVEHNHGTFVFCYSRFNYISCVTCHQTKQECIKDAENRDAFSELEHKHGNPVASLDNLHVDKSIIYTTMHFVNTTH